MFTKVAELKQLPEGTIVEATVEGRPLILINQSGQIRCLDAICSHEEVSLAGGFCENNCIVCPAHGAMFDLDTGAVKAPPAVVPIKTHQIKIQGEDVLVSLDNL